MKQVYPDNGEPLKPRGKPMGMRVFILACLALVVIVLLLVFPAALDFVEMAAREARYVWWLVLTVVLMVMLGIWLIWGYGRNSK